MRLIDLHCNWALQYACESSQYDAQHYGDIPARRSQLEGYLTGTSAAILPCARRTADWATQQDPWQALGEMVARYEAEFSGRLLYGPEDRARWRAEPFDGLTWGVLGIGGFDALVRDVADLQNLPSLFARGVRVFQLLATQTSVLGGAAESGDDRGLSDLGRMFLERLVELAPSAARVGPRPILDIADLNVRTTADVLNWMESTQAARASLLLVRSYGSLNLPNVPARDESLWENLVRMRSLGGVIGLSIGPPWFEMIKDLRDAIERLAEVPFCGRTGYEGIGIGTEFLDREQSFPDLEDVDGVLKWLAGRFPPDIAQQLASGNARALLLGMIGVNTDENESGMI
jgi:membrane dipeptidase